MQGQDKVEQGDSGTFLENDVEFEEKEDYSGHEYI